MSKSSVAVCFGVLALASAAVAGPEITYHGQLMSGLGAGGPFKFKPTGFTPKGMGVYLTPVDSDKFVSFCLERTENIYSNTVYSAVINDRAMYGSAGPGGDPLDYRSAFLYTKFIKGQMNSVVPGFDTNNSGHMAALQNAFWSIEDEGTNGTYNATVFANLLSAAALAVASGGEWDGKGIGNVRVLNLTVISSTAGRPVGERGQDMLVLIPLPGAGGMALAGVFGLAVLRRRR